jgi:hypothetical protein
MIRIASPAVTITLMIALAVVAIALIPLLFMFGERPIIESYGARRDLRLKRVFCLPIYLLKGKRGNGQTYYRATFITSQGKEEVVWFEATMKGEPVPCDGPFRKKA